MIETEYIKDEIGRCESVDDLRENIFPLISSQKDAWKSKISEILNDSGITKQSFADKCRVSRMAVNKWEKGAIPRNRETFLRIALAAGYDREETNRFLQRYGRFPELYPKSLADCVCIYVMTSFDEDRSAKYDYIMDRIKEVITGSDDPKDITTVKLEKQVAELRTDDELEEFIKENAGIFIGAYSKLYAYVKACIESNYIDPGFSKNVFEMGMAQSWSSSLKQCVSAIKQKKWYPTRNKIISLGLHLSLDHEQIDEMLKLAHMEPLCAKNIFESVVMFILDDAELNNRFDQDSEDYDPNELYVYAESILNKIDIPEVRDFISEISEKQDEW